MYAGLYTGEGWRGRQLEREIQGCLSSHLRRPRLPSESLSRALNKVVYGADHRTTTRQPELQRQGHKRQNFLADSAEIWTAMVIVICCCLWGDGALPCLPWCLPWCLEVHPCSHHFTHVQMHGSTAPARSDLTTENLSFLHYSLETSLTILLTSNSDFETSHI
ncbi:uncharacterized protein K452DRAFT_166887 [Aplosporella prunicola CBS 121167]|uniref:Uncharacterized protein n=1 Tax=Aplosporella prunicola CBS 121167 TaxID=1176127 RepID=A0A6A6BJW9_9PEZI|nr:uncharacterized protein K452DRAFT_166887 [Aplosporella prunicola CBS 121167]KAF2143117.1 hypothetical protein K452DRAFT_166887 [Aplosporella prunicola CBS 121167]